MPAPRYHRELLAAHHAVRQASIVTRAVQRSLSAEHRIRKPDDSPVTIADFAAQGVVLHELRRRLPSLAPVLAEEHSAYLRDPARAALLDGAVRAAALAWPGVRASDLLDAIDDQALDPASMKAAAPGAFWTLDPIDGTKGFIRGHQYSICLALIERGRVVVAALACPNLSRDFARPFDQPDPAEPGLIFLATLDAPTFVADGDAPVEPASWQPLMPVHPPAPPGSPAAPLRLCGSYSATQSSDSAASVVIERLRARGVMVAPPVRLDSQVKYAVVARGQMDAFLRMPRASTHEENVWDHAPGSLIAQQAGVVVTDCLGRALNFAGGATLAGNRGLLVAGGPTHALLHPAACEVLGN